MFANSTICYPFTQVIETTNYNIVEKVETRATTSTTVGSFTVENYVYIFDKPIVSDSGNGHGHTGHGGGHGHGNGHDHGHGMDNAGGGIVWGI